MGVFVTTDTQFWDRFVELGGGVQPVLLELGAAAILDDSQLFDILLLGARATTSARRYIVIHDGNAELKSDYVRYFPQDQDGDLAGYRRRIEASDRPNLHVFMTACQAFSGAAFNAARDFLKGYYSRCGLPCGGVGTDIFLGNYPTTAAGIHREAVGVFSFVLAGRKRFLFWPEAYFESAGYDRSGYAPLGTSDFTPYLSDAKIIDALPGQIVYWPAGTWHVAASSEWTVSFNVNLNARTTLTDRLLDRAKYAATLPRSNFGESLPGTWRITEVPLEIREAAAAYRSELLQPDRLERSMTERWLQYVSASGFDQKPPRIAGHLRPSDIVVLDPTYPVYLFGAGSEARLAVNGYVASISATSEVEQLLAHLNRGGAVRMAEVLADPTSVRSLKVQLLELLLSCGALTRSAA